MKSSTICVFFILLLFLIGCGSSSGGIGPINENYKQGRGELELIKQESSFPTSRHQNSEIGGTFVFQNKAGYDVDNVKISLVGLDDTFVQILDGEETKQVGFIEGKSLVNSDGEKIDVIFSGFLPSLPPGTASKKQNYLLHVTYNSKVEFFPTICVRGGQYNVGNCDSGPGDTQIIDANRPISYNGQGAPLSVTKLEVVPSIGDNADIEFIMNLRNQGKGKVKYMTVNRAALTTSPLRCVFKGGEIEGVSNILMPDNQQIDLVCSGKLQSLSPYRAPLFIEIFYEYELRLPQSLEIIGSVRG